MWVNRQLFDMIVADNKTQAEKLAAVWNTCHLLQGEIDATRTQKGKDDVHIDWMRHRVNALEKQNAVLINKAAGVYVPVPEIVPTRPGSMSEIPDFPTMPSFEDVGDDEAKRLKVGHDDLGFIEYDKT